jgi:cytochrome c-type biogenesis protein CcmE
MNAKLVIAILLVVASIGLGVTTFRKTLTPYTSFSEARRSGTSVQVNGVLQNPAGVQYDATRAQLAFALKDDKNEVMNVVYKGVKPVNFEQATNVVAIGTYEDGVFRADQLLVKCPSKYQAEGASPAGSGPARAAAPAAAPAGGGT